MEGSGLLVGGKGAKRSGRGTTRRSLAEMYSEGSGVGLQQRHGAAARGMGQLGHGPDRDARRGAWDARAFLAAPSSGHY